MLRRQNQPAVTKKRVAQPATKQNNVWNTVKNIGYGIGGVGLLVGGAALGGGLGKGVQSASWEGTKYVAKKAANAAWEGTKYATAQAATFVNTIGAYGGKKAFGVIEGPARAVTGTSLAGREKVPGANISTATGVTIPGNYSAYLQQQKNPINAAITAAKNAADNKNYFYNHPGMGTVTHTQASKPVSMPGGWS